MIKDQIIFRKHSCSCNGGVTHEMAPYVNLYVRVTNRCNARCLFCCNSGNWGNEKDFNFEKLFNCIDQILNEGIRINRLNITGGEPSAVSNLVVKILDKLNEPRYGKITVQINTNGVLPQSRDLLCHPRIDYASISVHHYDTEKLSEIYGVKISGEMIDFRQFRKISINASCNLIKGYIDNQDEVVKMLDFAADHGIHIMGFVSLMKTNSFCKERFVDFRDLRIDEILGIRKTREQNYEQVCKCANYLYLNGGKMVDIYMRRTLDPDYCGSSLLFDGQNLCQGFGSDNIIL